MKKLILLLAAGLMVSAFIFGCSTEDPWQPSPSNVLVLSFVSGPSDTIAYGANISFSWTSRGGVGEVVYRYRLGADSWSTWSNVTSVNYQDVTSADTMFVEAQDEANQSDAISQGFSVGEAGGADTDAPIVWIVSSPAEGSYVATGSSVTFTWAGEDAVDGDNLLYWYSWNGVMSQDTSTATTVTFADVQPIDAEFTVWAMDQSGNESEPNSDTTWWLDDIPYNTEPPDEPDSVVVDTTISFTIQNANILYIDDYEWLDAGGNRDMPKERDQKQFYRNALEGYAFAEWDVAIQEGLPDSSYLVDAGVPVFSTILFASDTYLGDASGTWWYEIQGPGETPIHYYLESGGNMIVTGPGTIPWMYNSIPPQAGDLEFDYFGIDSVNSDVIEAIDSTWWRGDSSFTEPIVAPDSVTVDTAYFDAWYDEWWGAGNLYFTWAVRDDNIMLDLPDSMKIDVAKNGDQVDFAVGIWSLRNDVGVAQAEALFKWGLYADDTNPPDIPPPAEFYQSTVGHITSLNSGTQWTAMLNFDTYSMPPIGMKQTFREILTVFGE